MKTIILNHQDLINKQLNVLYISRRRLVHKSENVNIIPQNYITIYFTNKYTLDQSPDLKKRQ